MTASGSETRTRTAFTRTHAHDVARRTNAHCERVDARAWRGRRASTPSAPRVRDARWRAHGADGAREADACAWSGITAHSGVRVGARRARAGTCSVRGDEVDSAARGAERGVWNARAERRASGEADDARTEVRRTRGRTRHWSGAGGDDDGPGDGTASLRDRV
jgi:hypothetical protein